MIKEGAFALFFFNLHGDAYVTLLRMLKTIKVDEVTLGMYIHALEGAWMDHPFWKKRFTLKSEKDLLKLQHSNVKRVVIDVEKGKDVETVEVIEDTAEPAPESQQPTPEPQQQVPDEQPSSDPIEEKTAEPQVAVSAQVEHAKAVAAISSAKKAVASMFDDVRMGKAIDTASLDSVVGDVTASIERNESALISLARLKNKDDYTYMHSVAVCGLMIALAKQLSLSESEIQHAGMAGLLHDIGKARVSLEILNKPGKLTDEEYVIVQKHAQHGYEMLKEAKISDPVALDVCLHHHEKYDGTGYPTQQTAEEISLFARMGAICDVYDAITSNRAYKEGWEPAVSLQRMAQWQGQFDEVIFKAFVKSLGIYPIGSTVKLNSERLAVVIDQNKDSLLTPMIRVFFSTLTKSYIATEDIDLVHSDDKIIGLEDPKDWGIKSVEDIWCKEDATMT